MATTAPDHLHLTLYYFNIHGLGARIRLAARLGGIKMADVRFSDREEFAAMRAAGSLPFGQVPLLVVRPPASEGSAAPPPVSLAQSGAILRYVCTLGGLQPSDPLQGAVVDSAVAAESDAFAAYRAVKYRGRMALEHLSDDDVATAFKELNTAILPRHLQQLETLLKSSPTGWVAGTPGPSAADLAWGTSLRDLAHGTMAHLECELASEAVTPAISAWLHKFLALPEVAAYYAEFP